MQNSFSIPVEAWYDEREIQIDFPERWQIEICTMSGHGRKELADDDLRRALIEPIASPPLKELARGKKEAAILFDDLSRPTPAWRVIPMVVDEMKKSGLKDEQIRFVAAIASHRPMTRFDLEKKVGAEVLERFNIFNHNPYEHLDYLGKTARGTPVLLNREVARCDLKIGIGCMIPHFTAGFGGGAKIVMPGVSGVETIWANHYELGGRGPGKKLNETAGLGKVNGNEIRLDMEEAARMARLDFKIDLMVNEKRQVAGVFAGDFVAQHRAGVEVARAFYGTMPSGGADIVVANAYPLDNSPGKANWPGRLSLKEGGDMVVIVFSPEGHHHHYVAGRFGTDYGGKLWEAAVSPRVSQAERMIIFSPYKSMSDLEWFGPKGKVFWFDKWSDVLAELSAKFGASARVAIYPYAGIQLPRGSAG